MLFEDSGEAPLGDHLAPGAPRPDLLTASEARQLRNTWRAVRRLEDDIERQREARAVSGRGNEHLLRLGDVTGNRTTWAMTNTSTRHRPLPGARPVAAPAAPAGPADVSATRLTFYPRYASLAEGELAVTVERFGASWRDAAAAEAARRRLVHRLRGLRAGGAPLARAAVDLVDASAPRRRAAVELDAAGVVHVSRPKAREEHGARGGWRCQAATRRGGNVFVEALGGDAPDPRCLGDALVGWLAALGMPAGDIDAAAVDRVERSLRRRAAGEAGRRVAAAVRQLCGAHPVEANYAALLRALAAPEAALAALGPPAAAADLADVFLGGRPPADPEAAYVPLGELRRGLRRLFDCVDLEPPPRLDAEPSEAVAPAEVAVQEVPSADPPPRYGFADAAMDATAAVAYRKIRDRAAAAAPAPPPPKKTPPRSRLGGKPDDDWFL